MNSIKARLGMICFALAAASTASVAHHSFSMFDMQKDITLEGTVKEIQWTNPHIWIQLIVKDESGKEVEWSIEGGSPNMLSRYGWNRNSLKPGDKAVAVIHPKKKANPGATVQGGGFGSISVNGQRIFTVRNLDTATPEAR